MTKTLSTQIQHRIDTPSNWNDITVNGKKGNYVPLEGELVVYSDSIAPMIKIGDGVTRVKDLPYVMSDSNIGTGTNNTIIPVPTVAGSYTYTGSNVVSSWNNYSSTKITRSGTTSSSKVGTYVVNFTPKTGYCWPDLSTGTKQVYWTINRATPTLTIDKTELEIGINSTVETITVTTNSTDASIYATSSNTSVVTVTVSNNIVTVTYVGDGSANILIGVAESTNYTAASISAHVEARSLLDLYAAKYGDLLEVLRDDIANGDCDPEEYSDRLVLMELVSGSTYGFPTYYTGYTTVVINDDGTISGIGNVDYFYTDANYVSWYNGSSYSWFFVGEIDSTKTPPKMYLFEIEAR